MALTRAMLKGMGLTEEQISAIIDEHTTVTGGLKDQIKQYKEDAEKLPSVQKELDDLKAGSDDWKDKYEKEHKAFDDYKREISKKETLQKIKSAYKKLLLDAKVDGQRIDSILKITDFSNMKLDGDNLVDADKLTETIKTDWKGFIVTTETKPAGVDNPPGGNSGSNPDAGYAKRRATMYHENLYGKAKENE